MEGRRPREGAIRILGRRLDEAIARFGLIRPGDAVLVAVSAGADSVALLDLLVARAPALRLRLGVAHFNHALRPEAGRDAEFVEDLAARHGLPCHSEREDVREYRRRAGGSLEEAARIRRYRFLEAAARKAGYARVALGHHADDSAETLLLNLLRGSGRRGLSGIAPLRPPGFIRPLILARRSEIERYVRARSLDFRSDATNADAAFDRNRIRGQLIPLLERDYHPGIRQTLSRTAEILRAEEDWLEEMLTPLYDAARRVRPAGEIGLRVAALGRMPDAALRRAIRRALEETCGSLRGFGFEHIERIAGLLRRGGDSGPLALPRGVRVGRRDAELRFFRAPDGEAHSPARSAPQPYAYEVDRPGLIEIPEAGAAIRLAEIPATPAPDFRDASPRTAFIDMACIVFPLTVRNFRPGDRFVPLGAPGTQKLKKYFGDHKIPPAERRRCPLLVSAGRIVWVAGQRLDHRARVTGRTRRVLKAELIVAPAPEVVIVGDRGRPSP
jgi:tRNA(Ile)-lysidine synthase